eukprot:m.92250 g.92250  ORF g.92250 m.92250 type:complete len:350 (-) comp13771_c0_seq1:27-1076(-)
MSDKLGELSHGGVVTVVVLAAWENASFIGDDTASLKLFGAVLPVHAVVRLRVEIRKNNVWLCGAPEILSQPAPEAQVPIFNSTTGPPFIPLESCGVIVFSEATKRVLVVRDYHTKVFIDVQFKLKAAFEGRIDGLPLPLMTAHIREWAVEELTWIAEWKLSKVWPFATAERLKEWNPKMKALDPQIKQLYRAAKAEIARRAAEERDSEPITAAWGFPKGGAKVVRGRVEQPAESAVRELAEETQIHADVRALQHPTDIARPGGTVVDRFFVLRRPDESGAAAGGWDVAAIEWRSLPALMASPEFARFAPILKILDSSEGVSEERAGGAGSESAARSESGQAGAAGPATD